MRDFLSSLIARFQAATRQERLYLILGVVVALFLLRFGVDSLLTYREGVKREIQDAANRLARAERMVGRSADVARELQGLRTRYEETVKVLIPGDTPTLAAAALQERVSSLATEKNVSLQTTQVMKDEAVGQFRRVSLRITASGELRDFADFLASLEYGALRVHTPFIEVTRRGAVVRGQTPRAVSATLEVAGIIQGSTKGGEADATVTASGGRAAGAGSGGGSAPATFDGPGAPAPARNPSFGVGGDPISPLDLPEGGVMGNGSGIRVPMPSIPHDGAPGDRRAPLGAVGLTGGS